MLWLLACFLPPQGYSLLRVPPSLVSAALGAKGCSAHGRDALVLLTLFPTPDRGKVIGGLPDVVTIMEGKVSSVGRACGAGRGQ